MTERNSGENVEDSAAYEKARAQAAGYADDPERLERLVERAQRKARAGRGPLAGMRDSLLTMLRLLRAWTGGEYRDIPWNSLLSIIAAVVYFVTPVDLVPDFLLGWGFVDDAALITWVLGSVRSDLDDFLAWEALRVVESDED